MWTRRSPCSEPLVRRAERLGSASSRTFAGPLRISSHSFRSSAFEKKRETDRSYFQLSARLLQKAAKGEAFPVFGTHDIDLLAQIREEAARLEAPRGSWEVHMLYGIRMSEQRALVGEGVPVRTLISYGEHWYPWYVRRLAERPANLWFVVRSTLATGTRQQPPTHPGDTIPEP